MNKGFKRLVSSLFKIGIIGFVGGSALIPVMHRKLVEEDGLVKEDEFNKDVSVAMITPGALPVEISAGLGFRACGIKGFFAAPIAISLPGVLISICFCVFFSFSDEKTLSQFGFLSMAIIPYIISVAIKYILGSARDLKNPFKALNSSGLIRRNFAVLTKQLAFCLVPVLVCAAVCALFINDKGQYIWLGALSSITSFGGGDAYLAIAEGMLVTTGILATADYYSVIVPVVNAVPGSILCKTLTCAGFFIGFRTTGSLSTGLAVALCGYICSISMSCGTYGVGSFFMESLEKLKIFGIIKKLMRIAISVLQLKVIWKLLSSFIKKGVACGFPVHLLIIFAAVLVCANLFLPGKKGIRSVHIVLISAVACVVFGNVGTYLLV